MIVQKVKLDLFVIKRKNLCARFRLFSLFGMTKRQFLTYIIHESCIISVIAALEETLPAPNWDILIRSQVNDVYAVSAEWSLHVTPACRVPQLVWSWSFLLQLRSN